MTKDTWDEILARLSVNLFLRCQKVAPGPAIELELARRLESPGLHLARHTYPADLRQPSTRESVSPLFSGLQGGGGRLLQATGLRFCIRSCDPLT